MPAKDKVTRKKDGIYQLLTNLELVRLGGLNMNSRFTVEGQLQGAHPSPLKGFSVEFADYRQYVPGDDLRRLDWRVFGRSERLYIRQYEEECNLRLYIMLDGSRSMAYGSDQLSKYTYAARLAAALAYVTVQQQDSVGLSIFNSAQEHQYPAKSGLAHLRLLANCLAGYVPGKTTDVARNIHLMAQTVQRRALIVLISDLYDDMEKLRTALAHFRRRKHDVIVYHILDRAEIDFPFRDLGNFRDLETREQIITNPNTVRHAYQEAFTDFLKQARGICSSLDIDYSLVTTDIEFINLVRQLLHRRMRIA